MKHPTWLSLFLVPVFTLAACMPVGTTIQPAQKTTAASPPVTMSEPGASPFLASTLKPKITVTNTPIPTVTVGLPTATITQNATPTPVDTLVPEQAQATMQSFLMDPMNCAVPCFWGITPVKTRFDDAKIFFSRLGFTPFEGYDPQSRSYFYTIEYKFDGNRNFSTTLYSTTNILVENIVIDPLIGKPEVKPREWIAYSPETVIKKYGEPSRVEFALDWGPNFVIRMIMYFDVPFLIAMYSGYNMIPGRPRSPRLCPLTAPFDHVRIWLGPNPPNPPMVETVALGKATSLAIDQFTKLMLGDPQLACFILNGDAFR